MDSLLMRVSFAFGLLSLPLVDGLFVLIRLLLFNFLIFDVFDGEMMGTNDTQ